MPQPRLLPDDPERPEADADEVAKLLRMIDGMPVAVMTADPADDFRINYMNRTSLSIMRRIEDHLPVKADRLVGQSIDIFHRNAGHQQSLLRDPANLPVRTKIRIGGEVLSFEATAIMSEDGRYLAPMVTWEIVTERAQVTERIGDMSGALADGYGSLQQQAVLLGERARKKAMMATNLATVAVRMESASSVISGSIRETAEMTDYMSSQAEATQKVVASLEERVSTISTMSTGIGQIVAQTNLLALNATIEAARAGDAGRGFAVVAQEVKALARQAAQTNEGISREIGQMLSATAEAARAIRSIAGEIEKLAATSDRARAANAQHSEASQAVSLAVSDINGAVPGMIESASFVTRLAEDLDQKGRSLREKLAIVLD